uniref:Glycine-rich protein n=1 Tax=Argas monolakensis TaxID=34602 RepID=Q09JG5_ARGMO|nr:glycine-rich protein [Argas monolakensis]
MKVLFVAALCALLCVVFAHDTKEGHHTTAGDKADDHISGRPLGGGVGYGTLGGSSDEFGGAYGHSHDGHHAGDGHSGHGTSH